VPFNTDSIFIRYNPLQSPDKPDGGYSCQGNEYEYTCSHNRVAIDYDNLLKDPEFDAGQFVYSPGYFQPQTQKNGYEKDDEFKQVLAI